MRPCLIQFLGAIMEQLKKKVKELQKRREWMQGDLAREMSVSLSTVQRWEKKRVSPLASPAEHSRDFSMKLELTTMTRRI